ncbi:MAG: L,D-transpeptidase family protein, partial [Actinobacteria bacterium]|nr:L,D-transpeptidase family protein [Actinomycetota bacterium]
MTTVDIGQLDANRYGRNRLAAVAVLATSALLLSACGSTLTAVTNPATPESGSPSAKVAATTNVDKKPRLPAGERVTFVANDPWLIESLTVSDESGSVDVGIGKPQVRWKSDPQAPGAEKTYTAQLREQVTGESQTVTRTVSTGKPKSTFSATVFPKSGTWGIGLMPTVTFDRVVPKRDRAALTERLSVVSAPDPVTGSWRWEEGTTVVFRPEKFWPAKTKVTVKADIENAVISGTKTTKNAYGEVTQTGSFRTDKGMSIHINGPKKEGTVKIDGKKVRTFPTSVGKAGFITRSGVKTITDMLRVTRMTNIGVTDDEVYDLQVPYAMRITNTGEFLHGAPWNGNIGYANTSHGCTNAKLDDAAWIFDRANWGTPVVTKGTGRDMETW